MRAGVAARAENPQPAAIPHTWREDGHICLTVEARTLRDFLSANSHRTGLGEDLVKGMFT